MKIISGRIVALVLLVAVFCLNAGVGSFAQNAKPFVVPEIQNWKGGTGSFSLANGQRVVAMAGTAEVATAFRQDMKTICELDLSVVEAAKAQAGDIVFRLVKDKRTNDEGYEINIGKGVEVRATTATGLYWATRTLLQMVDGKQDRSLPQGHIKDYPDFGIRGMMIDCGRKFIPIAYLRELIKTMGYYKMNCLQVHLNDNGFPRYFDNDWQKTYAAFRLECDTYPGLAARDGYYTKNEFRELQRLGMECGVEVIPEIDAPAHCLAFTHYDPSLGSQKYGVDHLDITNPKSREFVDALWTEYLEGDNPVFIGPRVHIGTDEYSNRDQEVVELFRQFTDHLIRHVESYGKQAVVWGSLTHARGTTPVKVDNVLMSLWSKDYSAPDSMIALGYKGISIPDGLTYIVPKAGYYYDYLNTKYLYETWTPNIAAYKNYDFDYDDKRIVGGMFAVWNDICGNGVSVKDIHHRVYPALQTLSAKFWTGKHVTMAFADFDRERLSLSEAPGVNVLGRMKTSVQVASLAPNSTFSPNGNLEVGYDFSVEFDLTMGNEAKGTVLLQSPNARFYLADPITGRMGYERDGYLYSFDFAPYVGEKVKVCIEGTNEATYLYINDQLAETKDGRTFWSNGKERKVMSETLVFPLQTTGNYKSQISNVTVCNKLRYTKKH